MQDEVTLAAPTQPNAARGDFVVRKGTFFRVGDYPDKQFGLSEAEADAAIAGFAPVPLNIEHIPTIFDGKLGVVRKLWREGQAILAEYAIPRWLQDVTQGEPIKISSEWNRTSKQPIGGAFVLHPRVADAVMQAAFREEGIRHQALGIREEALGIRHQALSSRKAEDGNGLLPLCCGGEEGEEGSLRGVGFAVGVEDENSIEDGGNAGKELVSMALLAGLRALFQRVGVSSEEIDAHLHTPELKGANSADAPVLDSAGTSVMSATGEENICGAAGVGVSVGGEGSLFAVESGEARFAAMEAELNRLRQQAQDAEQAARFTVDSRLIDGWVRAFQMTPAEAEAWRTVARDTPVAFAAAIPALNVRAKLPQLAGGATVKASETADVGRLEALTQQKMRTAGLDHTAAFKEVCGENRDLALSVRARSQEGN